MMNCKYNYKCVQIKLDKNFKTKNDTTQYNY